MPYGTTSDAAGNTEEWEDPRRARSRARLIGAAEQLLVEGGPNAVTIDAVTRLAGVARATLYRNFGTGAELVARAFEQLLPPVGLAPDTGTLRERLVAILMEQAQLLEGAPLQATALAWLGMSPQSGGQDEHQVASDSEFQQLRARIIELYRQPFDAVLASPEARAEFGPDFDPTVALAQLAGPLVFNRLVTHDPLDLAFCTRIVDDFLAAHIKH